MPGGDEATGRVVGHFLAADDAGLRGLREHEHEALGEPALVLPGHVSCPEQRAIREVILEWKDPGALLKALGGDATDLRL